MAGSVFDPEEDPEEQANGAGFAALLRALPTDESSGQVNLPNGGAIDTTEGLMPWEAGPDSKAGLSSDDERGRDEHQPSSYVDMANAAGPSSTDVDNAAQYGSDAIPTKAPTLPTPPTYADTAGDQAAITAQKASEDPSKYKASGWRRALAGIAGGMVAAGSRDPAAGWRVGEGVLNAPLDRAKAQWAAQEAPLQSKLTGDVARNQQLRQQYGDQVSQYGLQERDQVNQARIVDWKAQADQRKADAQKKLEQIDPKTMRAVDPNNPYGEYQGTNAKGESVRGLPPPDVVQKSSSYQQFMRRQDLKEMMRNGIRLSPDEAKYYVVNGKLAEPKANTTFRIPSAESEKYNDWKKQFQVDNRRAPNAAEIAGFGAKTRAGGAGGAGGFTKSLGDRIEANKGAGFRKAQSDFNVYKDPGAYQSDLQVVQNEYEQRLEDATGQEIPHVDIKVDKDGKVDWGSAQQDGTPAAAAPAPQATPAPAPAAQRPVAPPAPAPAPAAPAAPQAVKVKSGPTVKIGDPVTDGQGRTGTITGINPQTGKPKVKWSGAQ